MDKMNQPPFYMYFGQVCLNNQFSMPGEVLSVEQFCWARPT